MNKIKEFLTTVFHYESKKDYSFTIPETQEEKTLINNTFIDDISKTDADNLEPKNIYSSIEVNKEYLKVKYNSLINSDIIIREFTLNARNKQYRAFLLYIDGMVDSKIINDYILEPLMLRNRANTYQGDQDRVISEAVSNNITVRKVKKFDLVDYIYNSLVPQNSVQKITEFSDVLVSVNMGNCILMVDTIDTAFDLDVKGFRQRSISTPENEIVVRGSQEAFVEVIRTNTSILRRLVNNEDLIIEDISVGKLSRTKCAICYMKNIANNELVAEVKYRLNNVNVDYLISSRSIRTIN